MPADTYIHTQKNFIKSESETIIYKQNTSKVKKNPPKIPLSSLVFAFYCWAWGLLMWFIYSLTDYRRKLIFHL